MSVIFKYMEKPNSCHECPLYVTSICDGSEPCPIIPVKYGRCISDMAGNWCSVCGEISDCYFETNYCPNCGAPMDEVINEQE